MVAAAYGWRVDRALLGMPCTWAPHYAEVSPRIGGLLKKLISIRARRFSKTPVRVFVRKAQVQLRYQVLLGEDREDLCRHEKLQLRLLAGLTSGVRL